MQLLRIILLINLLIIISSGVQAAIVSQTAKPNTEFYWDGTSIRPININFTTSNVIGYTYGVTTGLYQAHFKADISTAETVRVYSNTSLSGKTDGKDGYVTYQPMSISYTNSINQLQSISQVQSAFAFPVSNLILYPGIFGTATSMLYEYQPNKLKESLIVGRNTSLAEPESYITANGVVEIIIAYTISYKDGTTLYVDGEVYTNQDLSHVDSLYIMKDDVVLLEFAKPYAQDNKGNIAEGYYSIKKQGQKITLITHIPQEFFKKGNDYYPIIIDPTIVHASVANPINLDDKTGDIRSIFIDHDNNRVHNLVFNLDADLYLYSASFTDLTNWTAGVSMAAFSPAVTNFNRWGCAMLDTGVNKVYCYGDSGGRDLLLTGTANLTDTTPFSKKITTLGTVADLSSQGGDALDDIEVNPAAYFDTSQCAIVITNIEDDSDPTDDEWEIFMDKEGSTCGDGVWTVATTDASFPQYDLTTDIGYADSFPLTLVPITQGDAVILWFNVTDFTNVILNARYYNNSLESFGAATNLSSDVEYVDMDGVEGTGRVQFAATSLNDTVLAFYAPDGTTDVYVSTIRTKNGVFSDKADTGIDVSYATENVTSVLSATVDTRAPGGDNVWVCAIDDADTDDLYCVQSYDLGLTWETPIQIENDIGGVVMALSTAFNNETCELYYSYVNETAGTYNYVFGNYNTTCGSNETVVGGGSSNTCSYTSGNWNIDCDDYCVINGTINLAKNNIRFNGTGTTKINGTIYNFTQAKADTGCTVTTYAGGRLG